MYDPLGRSVRIPAEEAHYPAGRYPFTWEDRADEGKGAAAGMYFLNMAIAGDLETHTRILLR